MPCANKKARTLLKEDKAKIVDYNPFTIQLKYATGETTQPVIVGVDTGALHIGIAIVSESKVLLNGEVHLRNDISKNVAARAILRRSRRNRKTRYRKSRYLNRKRKDGWLPPSVQSKLNATFFWIDKFCSLIPNPQLNIEVGKFDMAKMINPDISGKDYQNGNAKGYYDVRYFVFARDNYTCQVCKKKNKILHTHHIVYKSKGGTDRANNLITVCSDCHTVENHKEGGILYVWMIKGKKVKQYKEATFMNIIRKRTFSKYPEACITYGSTTSPVRKELQLSKTHYNDAIAITGVKTISELPDDYFYCKQFRKKKRSLHESTPRKGKNNKNTTAIRNNKNVKARHNIWLNDKLQYQDKCGWVYGYSGGESSYECILRDISGEMIKMTDRKNSLTVNMHRCKLLCHNNGWQYCILKFGEKIRR